MELKQALGNTWYFDDWQLIPLYRLDAHRCILLDSGLYEQREELEQGLKQAGLTPVGILGSHAHNDHSSNHHYFQQKYHIPVALSMGEAAVCCSIETLKSHFYMNSVPEFMANERVRHMEVRSDRIILPEEERIDFCGAVFDIVRTPGHSVEHISTRTPDGVLYLADALLTGEELDNARFPYHFRFSTAIETLERLKTEQAALYLTAHKGVYTDLSDLPERNIRLIQSRADGILELADEPLSLSELSLRICRKFHLRSRSKGATALYERNIRAYLEYLQETGRLDSIARDGIFYYCRHTSM